MQPTQVIPLLGIPVDSPSITLSLSVKELNTPRHERRCLLIHEYVAEPKLQIALHGVNDSSNSWRLIRTVIIFTESVIPPQAQTTSRMRSISVNGLVTFSPWGTIGHLPRTPVRSLSLWYSSVCICMHLGLGSRDRDDPHHGYLAPGSV